jgi:hypothetical protein
MANPNGNPQNLLPGGMPGNAGGGRWSNNARKAKAEWLEKMKAMKPDHPDYQTLDEAIDAKIASEALHSGYMAQWLREMEHGKPATKYEIHVGETEVFDALGDILPNHVKDQGLCEAILKDLYAALSDAGQGA